MSHHFLQAEEASGKLGAVVKPMVNFLSGAFAPWKGYLGSQNPHESLVGQLGPVQELARRMRSKIGHEQHV